MDKLAHYRAMAFVDELEKIAGYKFDEDVREYLYKEAAFNPIPSLMNASKAAVGAAKKVIANPTQAARNIVDQANLAGMKVLTSPGGMKLQGAVAGGGIMNPTDLVQAATGAGATQLGHMVGGKSGGWLNTAGKVLTGG